MHALKVLEAPDSLALSVTLTDGSVLDLQTAVRVVPQKRVVALGEWQHQSVYAKLFMGESAKRHAKRDAEGVKALQSAKIATPKLLFTGELAHQDDEQGCAEVQVLLLAAHPAAENAEQVYQRANVALKTALARKLVKTVARHHQANLLQTDLYFKNFLIDQGEVLTIDGDGIRQFEQLSDRQKAQNLAVLLSKIDVLDLNAWMPELIQAYQTVQPEVDLEAFALFELANQARLKAASAYADKKVFRQCTDVAVSQSTTHFSAIRRDYVELPIPNSVSDFDALVNSGSWLKKGNTCSVVFSQLGPLPVVVKRYNVKGIAHAISRFWRPSRASASWANTHRLLNLGITTPQAIALYERRYARVFRGRAYLVSRYLDAPDIAEFFALVKDPLLRASAVKQSVQLLARLHALQLSHGDLKASNIKMTTEGKPVLIDLDSMKQHKYQFFVQKGHVRDLKRFMQNWQGQQALYNAFLKSFKVIYQNHAPLVAAGLEETT